MAIEVIKPGLATTVQDLGRPSYYNIGIPLSGALDQYALRAANLLVGNEEGAAGLEIALMGPELVFGAGRHRRHHRRRGYAEDQRRGASRATSRLRCGRTIG